ncbi:MAG: carboxymuconolactone decarboxylase family protein [Novibacillus thermophilus]|jgi:AhpD family alkylhydroperoxidase|uniref:Alkylhydroperoxidase n=1 Tax=Novibacillus thermophilus TaxID=1471761 RepID=A0A1U9K746_9BACL|nr:carboxymuconolactone decarboxylase family protein [Novibacillus thermophilus]AQS55852.1 alkylhydroperoxidase [Novibacillus thermophilus]
MKHDHNVVKDNWTQLALQDYKQGLGAFSERMPELVGSFNRFTEECFKPGELDEKMKHLMALAVAVFANDEYCIIYHAKGALDQGASEGEIMEAVGVAAAFGGGAAMAQGVTLVQDAVHELQQQREVH